MNVPAQSEIKLTGIPLSGGCSVARVCMFNEQRHSNLPVYKIDPKRLDKEVARLERAIDIAVERLENIRKQVAAKIGKAEAEIFVAQQMILKDETLLNKILDPIRTEKLNAETAITRALDEYESRLLEVDNDYIRERATDLGEIKRRLLDVLSNMQPSLQCDASHCQKGKNRIIVAEELTPSLTVEMDAGHIMGFATERGGASSHAAILARALGVPAVSGLEGLRDMVSCGTEIMINGNTGEVVIWPREQTIEEAGKALPMEMRMPLPGDPVPGFKVMANISTVNDIGPAVEMKAEGIGLYRTEIELMLDNELPDEDSLFEKYMTVFSAMQGQDVVYRLLDVGSDKRLSFLNIPPEENPALGWRGGRLLLGRKDLLRLQARALARVAATGKISVLYPMIIDLDQFLELKRLFVEATQDIRHDTIWHGVMLEVPSACIQADAIMPQADFASIGTNDLIQYLFAVDRNNSHVAYDFRSDRPALWEVLEMLAKTASKHDKPLSICGELAGDINYIPRLMDLGVTTVSVTPRQISSVRAAATAYCKTATHKT